MTRRLKHMFSAHFNASNTCFKICDENGTEIYNITSRRGNYNNIPSILTQLLKYVSKNRQNNASNNEIHSSQSFLGTIAEPMEALFNERDRLNIETQTDIEMIILHNSMLENITQNNSLPDLF